MACYHPIHGTRVSGGTVRFDATGVPLALRNRNPDLLVTVPCGQCWGCLLERSRQWAVRQMHEAKMHERSCFITLTYDDDHLPPAGTLVISHWQTFAHNLRKHLNKVYGKGLPRLFRHLPDQGTIAKDGRRSFRYYHCGEYGEHTARPHYHSTLFSVDFHDDRKYLKTTQHGHKLYTSATLDSLWPYGQNNPIGACTFESAAYIARYCMKKITGKRAMDHYDTGIVDYDTGEVLRLLPEYTTMSRRPGIGKPWLDKYHADVYPDDLVVVNGKPARPPKFYDYQFEQRNPEAMRLLRIRRSEAGSKHVKDNTPERLKAREEVARRKGQYYSRNTH